jgi:NADPH:quinone reductase-like Zn-dependent oxidoreductase
MQQLAMLRINPPAAALILSEYIDLKPRDWVIQNTTNSGVGRAVIAFGTARGYRSVSLVRRPELVVEINALSGEAVSLDDESAPGHIAKLVGDEPVRLALDGVGGNATARLGRALSDHEHLVAYAFIGDYAAPADLRPLMEKETALHAFYQVRPEYDAKIPRILAEATKMIVTGKLYVPVAATYPLSAIKEAVAHAERGGKVLLDAQKH